MKLKQAFNNNVALALDNSGNEIIVMGKGVGFNKKKYEEIEPKLVDKIYSLDSPESNQLTSILNSIPADYIFLTNQIIRLGEDILQKKLSDAFIITLADHLNFALERYQDSLLIKNPLHWEVKNLYKEEYKIGMKALELIKRFTNIDLPEYEATSIALHFVNAQHKSEEMKETLRIAEITNKILEIISYHYQMKIQEDSINYSRLLTHLRYFILRQLNHEEKIVEEITSLYNIIKERYPDAYNCVKKIEKYLHIEYNWQCSNDELAYLTIHIHRMTSRREATN
ncbi:BglG family transcription antiterminator LicT [Bacillus sp. B1-b2]|uniref:BglG family transcription antiterminator LicT n=1 Tax=Bacillus sp. B1-b2 TaxID=2653201 RepID=UPI00126187CC|nr:PRD domain-containing protein [Bacillus sp. B1-b2]KAB7668407.1 PRD domain-containing protein [Bacillus sp. B1-b2]